MKKERNEAGNTSASMPIHNNVALLRDGVEDDTEEVIILLTSPSPRLVAVHQLIGFVGEVGKHAVFLDRES